MTTGTQLYGSSLRRGSRDTRAGAALAIGLIALWAFFVAAIVQPAARLHAFGAPLSQPIAVGRP